MLMIVSLISKEIYFLKKDFKKLKYIYLFIDKNLETQISKKEENRKY